MIRSFRGIGEYLFFICSLNLTDQQLFNKVDNPISITISTRCFDFHTKTTSDQKIFDSLLSFVLLFSEYRGFGVVKLTVSI